MMNQDLLYKLHDRLTNRIETLRIYKPDVIEMPAEVLDNLRYELFDWQKTALEHFLCYLRDCEKEPQTNFQPTHLLFNMATGSGKTLIMAACILYLYKQGYRHFIFTANYNNIVDKTQNNFIDVNHPKYLFKDSIIIDNKQIIIKEVDNFSNKTESIEIKFTSIQKLHNEIHVERENTNTLSDLNNKQIVILADEAHNLNAQTKVSTRQTTLMTENDRSALQSELSSRASEQDIERRGWEHTLINLILKKNDSQQMNNNILLEFTATVPNAYSSIREKYSDKLLYKFDLKDFLKRGYTKEIILVSSSLDKTQRMLLGLIFNWYRHRIALKYGIANFKPVILFRSKNIQASREDYQEFIDLVKNLEPADFDFLRDIKNQIQQNRNPALFEMARTKAEQIIKYLFQSEDNLKDLVIFLRDNFKENNVIITNSKNNKNTSVEKTDLHQDILLNSLENPGNHIRAIFTVKRLTEGWDVLNLFDIVRLFETRDEGKDVRTGVRKVGKSTIEECQLIGRGVRYYPFEYSDYHTRKRKFDDNLDHDLRILEEFCFHSIGSRYISELKDALIKEGYLNDKKKKQRFELKPAFKQTSMYQNAKIAVNKRQKNENHKSEILKQIKRDNYSIEYALKPDGISVSTLPSNEPEKFVSENITPKTPTITLNRKLNDYGESDKHIFLKAVNQLAQNSDFIYSYENLRQKLNIHSIDDLLVDQYIGDFEIYIKRVPQGKQLQDLDSDVKLDIAIQALRKISQLIEADYSPHKGSKFELANMNDEQFKEFTKEKVVEEKKLQPVHEDWYVLDYFAGTDQEEAFLDFMRSKIDSLRHRYRDVFLIRNEEVYKIYDFDKGRGFQPDFLLFLTTNDQKCCYQIFIEPKGGQYKDGSGESYKGGKEGWKENFLEQIKQRYKDTGIFDGDTSIEYKVVGLPFYNNQQEKAFEAEFDKILL